MSRKPLVTSFFICLVVILFTIASYAQPKPVIAGPIDDSVRVTVAGSKHPLAQAQYDAGTLDPGTKFDRMLLVLGPSPEQERELQRFMESQQDKTSPNYHHWLTPEEFGQKFGPAPEDIQAVSGWLQSHGFAVTSVARSGRWLEFSGTAGQTESAFKTVLRQYDIGGSRHIANATEISIPAAIAPVVRGVVSLHNFFKKPMLARYAQARPNGDGTYTPISPDATFNTSSGPIHALTPGDFAKIYQLNPLYSGPPAFNGAGTVIAIVARSDANVWDWLDFRSLTGVPGGGFTNTITPGLDPGFDPNNGDSVEANLDSQWAGGVAPGAFIDVVVSASTATSDGVDLSSAYIVDHNVAPVMTVSFGQCEFDMGAADNAFYNGLWEQAAAEGISVMVASGDSGAAGCDFSVQPTAATHGLGVSGLASTPFNTAVGGTEFHENGSTAYWSSINSPTGVSVNGYIPEVAWNESCDPTVANSPCASLGLFLLFSSGGGASIVYPKPIWQSGLFGIPNDLARDVPDVSLSAAGHDGYILCFDFSCEGSQATVFIVGGTSVSSPSFAGIMAIVNQAAGRQGQANYTLYKLASLCSSATRTNPSLPPPPGCIFNDVTSGTNSVPGQGGFSAGTMFDLTTGLGSVNAFNLVSAWRANTLQGTAVTLFSNGGTTINSTHGQPVPLSITVTGAAPSPAPGGGVALMSTASGPVDAVQVAGAASGNVATFDGTFSNLPGGSYNLTAHYSGDGQFAPADSNAVTVTISPETSVTALRTFGVDSNGFLVPATTFSYGSFMDLHADVSGASGQGTPTGGVTFRDTGTAQTVGSSSVNLKGESEVLLLGGNSFPVALTVGTHTLGANYSGDSSFISSSSAPLTVTITKANPPVTVSPEPLIATAPGMLTAFVDPTGPLFASGTVQFLDAGVPLGSPAILNGTQATLPVTFNTEAQHSITASYSGDGTYNAAVSAVQVIPVLPPFSITGLSLSATIPAGQGTTFNLFLNNSAPGTFSGTVALSCSSANAGVSCAVNPASVSLGTITNSAPITVSVTTTKSASLHGQPLLRWPMALAGVVAIALAGFRRRSRQPLFALVAFFVITGLTSCGGGSGPTTTLPPPPPPPTAASVVVTGTSGTHVATAMLNVTITH